MESPHSLVLIARFAPAKRDDLRPDAAMHIGKTFNWIYAGTQDDGSAYAGETTWDSRDEGWPGYWAPLRDLDVIDVQWRFPQFHEGAPPPGIDALKGLAHSPT